MTEPISVTHEYGERVVAHANGVPLMSYVYKPDPVEYESRKPYIHPLRTLGGNLVSGYRPNDHRWHKGVQMTASHLSEQNFWGGNSYIHGKGYQRIPERVGWMRHDDFESIESTGDRLRLSEHLTWVNNGGAEWAKERREVTVHSVDTAEGAWTLEWSTELTNCRDEPLHFGSPTTAGREMAGYTGLQWRGPRDFTGGAVFGPNGEQGQSAMMGQQAPWLAFTAEHDDVDRHSTLIFAHAPENDDAIHESHWFVRSEPIPTVAFSWAFFEEFELPINETFRYRYRIVVADDAWDVDRTKRYLAAQGW